MLFLQKFPSKGKLKMESGAMKDNMKGMTYFLISEIVVSLWQ